MAKKLDANGNTETYTYETLGRLTSIPDRQQTFTYDTCPTTNATGWVGAPGQLEALPEAAIETCLHRASRMPRIGWPTAAAPAGARSSIGIRLCLSLQGLVT